MTRFYLNTKDKKTLVHRLGELTGEKPRYTYVPRCAYECGPYTVEKNGDVVAADDADPMILQTLLDERLVIGNLERAGDAMQENTEPGTDAAEDTIEENAQDDVKETAEAGHAETADAQDSLTISLPMARHTTDSIRRLINMIYSRGPLLSKATGGSFGADKALVTLLEEGGIIRMEELIASIKDHGGLTGLSFNDGKINFNGFPMTEDPDKSQSFMQLASLMNKHAIEMKRIQAKEVNDENEKYAFRIWLLRLGMNSVEYKTARKVLMENLSGNAAFRTKTEEEKWKASQKAKRDELRAAKAAYTKTASVESQSEEGEDNDESLS